RLPDQEGTMKLTCQACGAVISLDAAVGCDAASAALIRAFGLSPLGKLLIQYLGLFRPAKRQLTFDRVESLLGELLPMIETGRIERSGRVWAAPHESWRAALEEILAKRDKLTLPLKSHGYLLEIIAGHANKAEAREEKQTEQERARPYRDLTADTPRKPMPAHVRETISNIVKKEPT
ncbi:MAG: hypothetical protein ACOY4U_00605, partial [Pseudomonadota bacterium]